MALCYSTKMLCSSATQCAHLIALTRLSKQNTSPAIDYPARMRLNTDGLSAWKGWTRPRMR